MSKTTSTIISTSIVWIMLIVLAVVLVPGFGMPSTVIRVQVGNTTNESVRATFFVSDGKTVGSVVPAGGEAEYILFEGELSNPNAPDSVHVLIAGDGTDLIFNSSFGISESKNGVVMYPASFVIKYPKEGETEKLVSFTIRGSTS